MKKHVYIVHEGHKDHKCDTCGKSFTSKSYFKQHSNTCGGAPDHKCEACGKLFYEERQLKNHIKSAHEGHKCDSCDKSFTHSTFLKRHYQTVHQGLKDYKCDFCGKFLASTHSLKTHIYFATQNVVFPGHLWSQMWNQPYSETVERLSTKDTFLE